MFEKVNPMHPDKIADRIAGAIVDIAYTKQENPKVAVEVLIGHNKCVIMIESSCNFANDYGYIENKVREISKENDIEVYVKAVTQDEHLARNQSDAIRCGDNGIFKGVPLTKEQKKLSFIVRELYEKYPTDGKYVIDRERIIACQSNVYTQSFKDELDAYVDECVVNPLGDWTGGINVDTGATNRKLGSDMADSVTGGGLHGKDLSKADVSVNIYAFLKAQETGEVVQLCCAIGDETIDGKPYADIVDIAKSFIEQVGGFEKFAEWGLIF